MPSGCERAHEVPQNPKGTEGGPHVRTHTDTRVRSASTLRYRRRGKGTEAREGQCRNFRAGGPTKRSETILCFTAISWRQGERGRAKVRSAPRNRVRLRLPELSEGRIKDLDGPHFPCAPHPRGRFSHSLPQPTQPKKSKAVVNPAYSRPWRECRGCYTKVSPPSYSLRSSDGRVVKALDLKSNGVSPRRFEPCSLRKRVLQFFNLLHKLQNP